MRKTRIKNRRKLRKGIVGIEAAIVLIAFVLVASALAFVVLNMGMFTTQKSKEVIARAYEESTRALDVAGSVVAKVDTTNKYVDFVAVPIKLTAGARPIDLNKTVVSLTIIKPDGTSRHYDNALNTNAGITYTIVQAGQDLSSIVGTSISAFQATWLYTRTDESTGDNLLEPGEIVLLVAKVSEGTKGGFNTTAYSRLIIEIKPPAGSVLTVERVIPPKLDTDYVNLDVG